MFVSRRRVRILNGRNASQKKPRRLTTPPTGRQHHLRVIMQTLSSFQQSHFESRQHRLWQKRRNSSLYQLYHCAEVVQGRRVFVLLSFPSPGEVTFSSCLFRELVSRHHAIGQLLIFRWNQPCADEHMHRGVGTITCACVRLELNDYAHGDGNRVSSTYPLAHFFFKVCVGPAKTCIPEF